MVTMSGKRSTKDSGLEKQRQVTHYKTWEVLPGRPGFRLCNHCCLWLIGASPYVDAVAAWGYDGLGPNLTSAGLIGLSMAEQIPVESWKLSRTHGVQQSKDWLKLGLSWCFAHGCIVNANELSKDVIPYYRDFTKEHTSKWGDEWTMTSDEVMAWLVSKGYKQKEKVAG